MDRDVAPALGLIEHRGPAAALEAGDAMVKPAVVGRAIRQQPGGGSITIMVQGDVGSVQAAVEAGAAAAARVGKVISTKVVAVPTGLADILERPAVR